MPLASPRHCLAVIALVLATGLPAAAQTLDTTFQAAVVPGSISAIAVQPDGRIVVGGSFSSAGTACGPTIACPVARSNIARFNADGSLDADFNPGTNGEIFALALQSDGKILAVGGFTTIGGGVMGSTARKGLARLNADGSVDVGFDPVPAAAPFQSPKAILVQPDGAIIVGGITQLKTTGGTITLQGIGRILLDGTADTTYTPGVTNGGVDTLALDAQSRLLAGGSFRQAGSGGVVTTNRERIARYLITGALDPDFNPGVGVSSAVDSIAVQPDGKILVGGPFKLIGGGTGTQSRNFLARLDATGVVEAFDSAIDAGSGFNSVRSIALQADGKIVIGGTFSTIGGLPRLSFGRLNADGTVDTNFASLNGVVNNTILGVVLQGDGKILVGGVFTSNNGAQRNRIARIVNTATATESLTVGDGGTSISWARGGTSVEAHRVTFETNTGGPWTFLGAGTRIVGGWQLTGLSLPPDPIIRARAFDVGARGNGSGSILVSVIGVLFSDGFE